MEQQWPSIVALEPPEVSRFPLDALPLGIRTYVRQVAESYQVPPDLPACLAMSVISASIAGSYQVQLGPDWAEHTNLYVAVVLGSGERKSAVFRELVQPLEDFEKGLCATQASTHRDGVGGNFDRLVVDDCTPEQLASLLATNHGRIALLSSEGGAFDIMCGRYSKGVPNLDVYLKAYSGDSLRVDRRNAPPSIVRSPTLTMA